MFILKEYLGIFVKFIQEYRDGGGGSLILFR